MEPQLLCRWLVSRLKSLICGRRVLYCDCMRVQP